MSKLDNFGREMNWPYPAEKSASAAAKLDASKSEQFWSSKMAECRAEKAAKMLEIWESRQVVPNRPSVGVIWSWSGRAGPGRQNQ